MFYAVHKADFVRQQTNPLVSSLLMTKRPTSQFLQHLYYVCCCPQMSFRLELESVIGEGQNPNHGWLVHTSRMFQELYKSTFPHLCFNSLSLSTLDVIRRNVSRNFQISSSIPICRSPTGWPESQQRRARALEFAQSCRPSPLDPPSTASPSPRTTLTGQISSRTSRPSSR